MDQLKEKPVYFTLDLDVLDPSVFPGTGTPEAGGVSFQELLEAMIQVSHLNIVGFDVNSVPCMTKAVVLQQWHVKCYGNCSLLL